LTATELPNRCIALETIRQFAACYRRRYQFSALANDGQDTLLARADQVIE
jgi:hypothetical protein